MQNFGSTFVVFVGRVSTIGVLRFRKWGRVWLALRIMQLPAQRFRVDDAHFAFGRLTDVASFAFDRVDDRGTKVRVFFDISLS